MDHRIINHLRVRGNAPDRAGRILQPNYPSEKSKHGYAFLLGVMILGVLFWAGAGLCAQAGQRIWKNQPEKVKAGDDVSFIYQQDVSSQLTVIHILFKGGKRAVPVSQRGLAFLTTRLAVELPTRESLNRLMQSGTTVLYHVEGDYVTISLRCLSENLDETLKIVTRVIKNPLFSGLRIHNVKNYMEHRQKSEADSPEQLMELTLLNAVSTSYGGSIFGSADSLANIAKKDIVAFYHKFFNYPHMIITVCSDLEKAVIIPIIEKYFASFPPGKSNPVESIPTPEPDTEPLPDPRAFFFKKEQQQVLIAFGAQLPGMNRDTFALNSILENLLGEGIGSRLWPLRANRELAYSLKTRYIQLKDRGLLTVFLKTGVSKKAEAYQALKAIIVDLYRQGIGEQELEATRTLCRADFLRNHETKESRARQLANFEALGVGFDFLEDFFPQLARITPDSFNGYLKQVLNPAQLLEVVIGPESAEEDEDSLKAGSVGSMTKK